MAYDENGNWYDDQPDYGGDQTGYNPGGQYDLSQNGGIPSFNDSTDVVGQLPPLNPDDPNNYGDPNAGWAYPQPEPVDLGNGGGGILSKLKDVVLGNDKSSPRSDILRGAGLNSLGQVLASVFSKPLFQQRFPFTGSANPQSMMESGISGLQGLKGKLDARPPVDLSGITAQNPMNGMANDTGGQGGGSDEVRKLLMGLK